MSKEQLHSHPGHVHQKGCGHTAIKHNGHIDYLHDSHLHHPKDGKGEYVEHVLEVTDTNPDRCQPIKSCGSSAHTHGPGCGHEAIKHGNHIDYIVDGRLHHVHDGHCDDHGPVDVVG